MLCVQKFSQSAHVDASKVHGKLRNFVIHNSPRVKLIYMLLTIFPELQLEIARFLTDPSDCAALCLAVPRGLGLAALRHRELPQYKEILVSVALRLFTGDMQIDRALLLRYLWDARVTDAGCDWLLTKGELQMDEALLRQYLSDKRVSVEGCEWLTDAAQRAGSPLGIARSVSPDLSEWHLTDASPAGQAPPAAAGALVRKEHPNGIFSVLEGERGAERFVRTEMPSGSVFFWEGESGAERKVRQERQSGNIIFYEGESGAERKVRSVQASGDTTFFEGERGAERVVRVVKASGLVIILEGERGAERLVRKEMPDGRVGIFGPTSSSAEGLSGRRLTSRVALRAAHPRGGLGQSSCNVS